ncbi:DASS family sodium-coupled anion symporter [Spongiactinospora sp. TRM90649]|uniref:SLC13 family permease n=1 Tax=Spongiactinospora sp. TRM90649 TaxID=3031114 RepID=UPI0023FA1B27|nr:DASS family sodium-coupled anion symporter [Spongiactinospora sp. TRM90649]MDF5751070.1 DASS family sodium-coupled anion symporter [Spongiactinospora sp. TRM90649]
MTYRTLDEIRETLSPAEERFERARRTTGLWLAPLTGAGVWLAASGLPGAQRGLAAILGVVVVAWITEAVPIPMTATLGLALCVLTGVAPAAEVFGAFANPTIFLLIGSFVIAEAMTRHGLHRRFAYRMLSLPGVAASTHRTIIVFGVTTMALSAFVSNTATTAMLLPTALGVVSALSGFMTAGGPAGSARPRFAAATMLMLAYSASIGGLLTPIGSPPNLIGRRLIEDATGRPIPFFTWVAAAAPIVLVMFAVLCVVLLRLNRPESRRIDGAAAYVAAERARLGRMSAGERNALVAFGTAVTLWVLPGVVALAAGDDSAAYRDVLAHLDEGAVAVLAAVLLFVLPVDWRARRFTLTWNEAVRIDWGTILLFGSGIALGGLMSRTGLAASVGDGVAGLLGASSTLGLTVLATVVAIVISETTSNTASVGVVVPIILPIAAAAGVDPVVPALAAIFGASYGFMLPVSTPPNAIVYGSGMVPIGRMLRSGLVFDVLGAIVIVAGVTLMARLAGLA